MKQRNFPVSGSINIIGGQSGLPKGPGKKFGLTVKECNRCAKIPTLYYTVEINFILTYKSKGYPVTSKDQVQKAVLNDKCIIELESGEMDCSNTNCKISFWEQNNVKEENFLGDVLLTGSAMVSLFDNEFAVELPFDMARNPKFPEKMQRMVRGQAILRGGIIGARKKIERVLIIKLCRNLGIANFIGGSSDPFVTIKWNKKEIGRTSTINNTLNPVWNEEIFYLKCPSLDDIVVEEKKTGFAALMQSITDKFKPPEIFEPPDGTSKNCTLSIEVWDENAIGGQGSLLGGVYLTKEETQELLESYEPVEKYIPLAAKNSKTILGVNSDILIMTTGLKYISPNQLLDEAQALVEQEKIRREIEAIKNAEKEKANKLKKEKREAGIFDDVSLASKIIDDDASITSLEDKINNDNDSVTNSIENFDEI